MANGKSAHEERRAADRPSSGMIDKVVHVDRKRAGVSALVVVGDGQGKVGFGAGTAKALPAAIRKGIALAKKNMIAVATRRGTIPYGVIGVSGSGKVLLAPALEGGIEAGATVRAILESAGIRNATTQSFGASTPLAEVKATFDALRHLPADLVEQMETKMARRRAEEQQRRLISAMLPLDPYVPLPPQILQARRNAAAREELLREFGALTSADVGALAGSQSPNRGALAHRWKSDGRIFSVEHQGKNYFPGFQFSKEGQPLPVIAEVLQILTPKFSPWELALWFSANNGWLGGQRPIELLASDAARVAEAARREAEELVF